MGESHSQMLDFYGIALQRIVKLIFKGNKFRDLAEECA